MTDRVSQRNPITPRRTEETTTRTPREGRRSLRDSLSKAKGYLKDKGLDEKSKKALSGEFLDDSYVETDIDYRRPLSADFEDLPNAPPEYLPLTLQQNQDLAKATQKRINQCNAELNELTAIPEKKRSKDQRERLADLPREVDALLQAQEKIDNNLRNQAPASETSSSAEEFPRPKPARLVEHSTFTEEQIRNLAADLQTRIKKCKVIMGEIKAIPAEKKTLQDQERFNAAKEELEALSKSKAELAKSQIKPIKISKKHRSEKTPRSSRQLMSPRVSSPRRPEKTAPGDTALVSPRESKPEVKSIQPAKANQLPMGLMAELKKKLEETQDEAQS